MATIIESQPTIEYPSSDGQPMAETGIHVCTIMWLHQALEDFFKTKRTDVLIASDMFWYWEEGTLSRVAPDVMVVPGVGSHFRRSYQQWEENSTVPSVVFEIASEGTWRDDLDDKYDLYEKLGVKEYFLFDPESLYLVPQLQGFRRQGTVFRRIRQSDLTSELGFGLRAEDTMLRLIDLQTGQPVLTRAEAVLTAREQANAAAEQARTAVEQARTAVEQARTALEQANAAQSQANIARQLAQSEKERADALQAELDRLRATMDKSHGESGSST